MCSFCNQRVISGQQAQPTVQQVQATLKTALQQMGSSRAKNAEIAFFGGSFTAINKDYMQALLACAAEFLPFFGGIRISTRPDCIDVEILTLLKTYGVTAIELGAQSMNDSVLAANLRGHTVQDVVTASALIKSHGFELGLQMMTGLYTSTPDDDFATAEQIAALQPNTVRVYPTVVLKNTYLHSLFLQGEYTPPDINSTAELCAKLIDLFEVQHNIPIIRMGLHAADSIQEDFATGVYHPAFRELAEGVWFKNKLLQLLAQKGLAATPGKITAVNVFVNSRSLSKLVGQKKCNLQFFASIGFGVNVFVDDGLGHRMLEIRD
jgi:histone acetyltransferase (RNA polymerase elongator complex component)